MDSKRVVDNDQFIIIFEPIYSRFQNNYNYYIINYVIIINFL
jgi:hypothetical protein